jgi:CelD/BcsL family acetyltransferase involved in cellulose biosynthesis
VSAVVIVPELRSVQSEQEFLALEGEWDRLVAALERPTPFLLHAWCAEWLSRRRGRCRLAVEIAVADGRLLAALPFVSERQRGLTVGRFIGGGSTVYADALVAPQAPAGTVPALVERAAQGLDYASLQNLPERSNLVGAMRPDRLWLHPHQETARWRLEGGWEEAYRARTSSRTRNLHQRRRRQLGRLGRLDVRIARSREELRDALEVARRLHALRWHGRPDRSGFATAAGQEFHRSVLDRLAPTRIPRITTLHLDGRPIAFVYALVVRDTMFVFRLAFDPEFARYSPGMVTSLAAMEDAARDGATTVDFLPGDERYKLELATEVENVYMGVGLPRGMRGRAAMILASASRRTRSRLKDVRAVRDAHAALVTLRNRTHGG